MKIYTINQNKQLRRWLLQQEDTSLRGSTRVEPVNINESSLKTLLKNTSDVRKMRELSLQLTVANILDGQTEPVLILEDDCYFTEPFHESLLSTLPETADMAILGCYFKPETSHIAIYNTTWSRMHDVLFWGCHAVVYFPRIIPKLVGLLREQKQPAIDRWYSKEFVPHHEIYVLNRMSAWQRGDVTPGMHGNFQFDKMTETSIEILRRLTDESKIERV
jgi:hypothetical protein